jgi:uridine phosphorylase
MDSNTFIPRHLNANIDDLMGNNGIGRYILLPGSDGRAKEIAEQFNHLTIKSHPRGHHLYLGTIRNERKEIDVATIASGMGCSSMEIILHELHKLGGKRFLRIGTAGSLQSTLVKQDDIINVQAAVRDERTTCDYAPLCLPAIASVEFVSAIIQTAKRLGLSKQFHTGIVHCKSSLFAREFGAGPKVKSNKAYLNLLSRCGVLGSEMETSALFIQTQIYNYDLMQKGSGPQFRILCGAILGVVSSMRNHYGSSQEEKVTITKVTELALETIKYISSTESEYHADRTT